MTPARIRFILAAPFFITGFFLVFGSAVIMCGFRTARRRLSRERAAGPGRCAFCLTLTHGCSMSQHRFSGTDKNGISILVTMGYDRPLDYVFMTVEARNGFVLYSNLADPVARTARTYAISRAF